MARKKVTPPIGSKGLYSINTPFTLVSTRVYQCVAIREITDLLTQHVNVYKEYYEPNGLSEEIYNEDVLLNVAIVTLVGQDGPHYIPDTYIESYPELGIANYKRRVLSIDLGAVHASKNLQGLMDELVEVCSDFLGVKATVKEHTTAVKNVISNNEAKQIETVRTGKVNIPDTDYLKAKEAKAQKAAIAQNANSILLKVKGSL